jgi:NAD(P)H dehydrogenase (quinone)
LAHGVVLGSAGEGRISSASREDYAAAAAAVLTRDGQAGKVYELAGDASYTLAELAAEISRQTGRVIPYQNLPEPEYKGILLGAGLPEGLAALLADSDTGVSKGGLFDASQQLSALIGRPSTPLAEQLKAALAAA